MQTREACLETKKRYRDKNRKEIAAKQRKYSAENRESCRAYDKKYRSSPENREKLKLKMRRYFRNRYNSDPDFKAMVACRNMLKRVLRNGKKGKVGRTEEIIGYTYSEFKKHIESLFEPWMNWENHGAWHIDHVKPICLFISEGVTGPCVINALANLSPISAEKNYKKGGRYEFE